MDSQNLVKAKQFSQGNFKSVYPSFSDAVEWNIVGNQVLKGKTDTIIFCDKMLQEMESSELTNNNIIETKDQIVIEGNCRYFDAEGTEAFVKYCDIYRFENDTIKTITSYCI